MDSVVERLIVAVGAQVDGPSTRAALQWHGSLAAAAATAGVAVAGLAVATARDIDVQAKAARSLAITVEEYSALAYAADRSGVSVDQMGASLRSLQMQIAAAAAGSQEARKDFATLGIDITGAEKAADLLPRIADGLRDLPDGERLGVQLRLLGEGGARMSSLLEGGSEGLAALTSRAERLGLVIDSDTAAASERLMDALTDIRGVARGAAYALGDEVIPVLADATEQMAELVSASDGFAQVAIDRAARAAGIGLDFLTTPAGKAATAMTAVGAAIGLVQGAPGMLTALEQVSPGAAKAATSLGALALRAGPTALAIAGVALVLDDLAVGAQGGDSAILDLAEAMGVGTEASYALASAGELVASAWAAIPGVLEGVSAAIRAIGDAVPSLQPLIDLIPELGVGGALTSLGDTFSRAAEGYRKIAAYAAGSQDVELSGAGVNVGVGLLAAPLEALALAATGAVAAGRAEQEGSSVGAAVLGAVAGDDRSQVGQALSGYAALGREVGPSPAWYVGEQIGGAMRDRMAGPVQVQVDVSGTMDARSVAAQAGRQTERGVYDALQALEEQ